MFTGHSSLVDQIQEILNSQTSSGLPQQIAQQSHMDLGCCILHSMKPKLLEDDGLNELSTCEPQSCCQKQTTHKALDSENKLPSGGAY